MGLAHGVEGHEGPTLWAATVHYPSVTAIKDLELELLALTSVKRVGDLQVLSISPACLEDSKVVLKQWQGYVPKVLSTPFRAQAITVMWWPL